MKLGKRSKRQKRRIEKDRQRERRRIKRWSNHAVMRSGPPKRLSPETEKRIREGSIP